MVSTPRPSPWYRARPVQSSEPEVFGEYLLVRRLAEGHLAEAMVAVRLGDRSGRTFVVKRGFGVVPNTLIGRANRVAHGRLGERLTFEAKAHFLSSAVHNQELIKKKNGLAQKIQSSRPLRL